MIRLGMHEACRNHLCTVGINSNVQNIDINLYPNPAIDQITLEYNLLESAPVEIRITDINGRVVLQENTGNLPVGEHQSEFNIQHLPPGVYALNLIHSGEVISNKFVVQR